MKDREYVGKIHAGLARWALFGIYLAFGLGYFTWRIGWSMDVEALPWSVTFLVAELFLWVLSVPFYVNLMGGTRREGPPPSYGPSVDVFIATYNEDLALVRSTVVAARELHGPHTTWICDDGRRSEMRALAEELGVGYLTRPDNSHYKAGNLNNALAQTNGELVLVLDADHVVRPQLLERLVGYFREPKVALVQIPQVYYNLESFQHVLGRRSRLMWHESSLFHHAIQAGADRWNTAFFVGTGAVLRRSALDEVGGFATGTITEDVHTSLRLHAKGYRTVFVDEALGFMLAPETPFAYVLQRLRWAQGSMQVLRWENPLFRSGLTAWQRVAYLAALGGWLSAYARLAFYLAPVLYLLTGISPIDADLRVAAPILSGKVALDVLVFWLMSAPHVRLFVGECFHMVNIPIGIVASMTLLRPGGRRFVVTPKGAQMGLPPMVVGPILVLFLLNLAAAVAGLVRLGLGAMPMLPVLFSSAFAMWFGAAAGATLLYAIRRRASEEAYAFPVRVPATLALPDATTFDGQILRLNKAVAHVRTSYRVDAGASVCLEDQLEIGLCVDGLVRSVRPDPSGRPGFVVELRFDDAVEGRSADALEGFLFDSVLPAFLASSEGAPPGPPPEHPTAIPSVQDDYALVARLA